MPTYTMKAVPRSDAEMRFVQEGSHLPLLKGLGGISYLCGSCGALLIQDVTLHDIQGYMSQRAIFQCPACTSYGEIDWLPVVIENQAYQHVRRLTSASRLLTGGRYGTGKQAFGAESNPSRVNEPRNFR